MPATLADTAPSRTRSDSVRSSRRRPFGGERAPAGFTAPEPVSEGASTTVCGAGQMTCERLYVLRVPLQVLATGTDHDSRAFRDTYHPHVGAVRHHPTGQLVREEPDRRAPAPAYLG